MSYTISGVREILARQREQACGPNCDRVIGGIIRHEPNCRSWDIIELCEVIDAFMDGDVTA